MTKKKHKLTAAFFTESGTNIGYGHLVRSYALREKLNALGYETFFFLDSDINVDEWFNDINYLDWKKSTIDRLFNLVIIDSYLADRETYLKINKFARSSIFFDDYDRIEYPEGAIINFAPGASKSLYKNRNKSNKYLLGLDYLPLRDVILKTKLSIKKEHIFISLGGNDLANLSMKIIDALKEIKLKKVIVTRDPLLKKKLSRYQDIEILVKPKDRFFAEKMSKSIAAISTASMTSYELAYFNIPTLLIPVAENQRLGVTQLLKNNIGFSSIYPDTPLWKLILKNKVKSMIALNKKYKNKRLLGSHIASYIKKNIEFSA